MKNQSPPPHVFSISVAWYNPHGISRFQLTWQIFTLDRKSSPLLSSFSFFPFCFHGVATLWDYGQCSGVRHSLCSLSIFFVALISFVGGSLFLFSATSGHRRLHAIYCISLIHSGCNVLFYMLSPLGIRGGEGHLSISEERDWHEYSELFVPSGTQVQLGYRGGSGGN